MKYRLRSNKGRVILVDKFCCYCGCETKGVRTAAKICPKCKRRGLTQFVENPPKGLGYNYTGTNVKGEEGDSNDSE